MSVFIHSSPEFYTPSDNPIVWVFGSDQTGQANFSFIVEAYVNGVLDSRHEIFPEVGSRAHFDMSQIMRRLTPVASPVHTTVVKNAGNTAECYIIVRERYGTTPAYHASNTSQTVTTFKASLTNVGFTSWFAVTYQVDDEDRRFMTDSPNTIRINPDKDNIVSIIGGGETGLAVVFKLYEADGTAIPSADVPIPDADAVGIIQINLRSSFLTAETIITQAAFDAADYMEYYIEQGGGTVVSETKRIYFDHSNCGNPSHFVWLNKFGSFDCFSFSHNRIYSSTIESEMYGKQFGEWQGNTFVSDPNSSGIIDYLKRTRNRMRAVSGFIYEDHQNFLVTSMYSSPLCYLKEDGFVRVKIESTAYELQNDDFTDQFSEEVEISFPNTDQSVVL